MERARKILNFYRDLEACRRHYQCARPGFYWKVLCLLRAEFSPKELFVWGLLDPRIDKHSLRRYLSKFRLSKFQSSVSPTSHACLLENKELFYRFSEALNFPVPETIAFLSDKKIWFPGEYPQDPEPELQQRLQRLQGAELIVKPAGGVYGSGIRALTVDNGELVDDGRRLSVQALMAELEPGERYILQMRLQNHPDLAALTGFKTLLALRVETELPDSPASQAKLVSAYFRVSVDESVANNFDYGRGGRVIAKIDVESGRVIRAVHRSESGYGMQDIEQLPLNGKLLIGLEIPLWQEVRQLLENRVAAFYPIRLAGWDVAVTPDGPSVLEGNFWFDPLELAFGESAYIDAVNAS